MTEVREEALYHIKDAINTLTRVLYHIHNPRQVLWCVRKTREHLDKAEKYLDD